MWALLVVFLLVFLVCMCMGNALHVLFDSLRSAIVVASGVAVAIVVAI